ncbi:MAG: histidine kinase-, DNA gyrase B-, and HSP90-like ATPase [Halonotius sp. J07HN6]|nr:MAG: histidine kinase-, DNA gyrase B-, and HSP90-like ATPase [Halonotius sp. J07HN6]
MDVGTESVCEILISNQSDIAGTVAVDTNDLLVKAVADNSVITHSTNGTDSLLTRVYRDDVKDITDCTEDAIQTDDPQQTTSRVQLSADEWCIFEFTIYPAKHFSPAAGPLFTGTNVTDEHFLNQRREVINRVLRHNLRNDLEVVDGYTTIAREECGDAAQPAINQIESISNKLLSLGEKMRDIDSHLHSSNYRLRRVNLGDVVGRVVETYHEEHPTVTFRLNVAEAVVAGNSLVSNAVEELVENAIDHADRPEEETVITITFTEIEDNDEIKLVITDNGRGIPRGEAEAISEGTESELNHSSGVGLWLVKWISDSIHATFDIGRRTETSGTEAVLGFKNAAQLDESDELFSGLNQKKIIRTELPDTGSSDIATSTRG